MAARSDWFHNFRAPSAQTALKLHPNYIQTTSKLHYDDALLFETASKLHPNYIQTAL